MTPSELVDLRAHFAQAASHETVSGIDLVRLPGRESHGNTSATVDFIMETLPSTIQASLVSTLAESDSQSLHDSAVSKTLSEALIALDERIKNDFISLLPHDLSESGFDATVALRDADGKPCVEVERAVSGTTATVALVDPSGRIHVASIGDCDTFLCADTGDGWDCQDMGFHHQCSNPVESVRILAEHPGEPECVSKTFIPRLLGRMILSRGIGDMQLKLPVNLLRVLEAAWGQSLSHLIDHTKTPPYMSNIPEISHAHIPGQKFLIVASDGLDHLMRKRRLMRDADARDLGRIYGPAAAKAVAAGQNLATEVLWDAFAGDRDDEDNIYAAAIAGKLQGRVDDIAIAVVPFQSQSIIQYGMNTRRDSRGVYNKDTTKMLSDPNKYLTLTDSTVTDCHEIIIRSSSVVPWGHNYRALSQF
ncbi:phosphatase 2C-like domain-containing protein [Mycena haematopus]|nr:phosphatase 2C-like domain-containing protein [Mycena haematopus]